jgi:cytochrome c553
LPGAWQLAQAGSCHAPGKPYPVLAGQSATYIAQRLRNWRGDETVVDARKSQATMPVIARRIPEDMIDPIAAYLAGK